MEHVLLKATTVAADLGEFEAVISTEAVDREKDIVSADAMVTALHKWNRPIPLSWNHGLKAEDIFGHVDPQSARNAAGEVVIQGKVDTESKMGGEAWRSFKNRTVGFSFGYLIPDGGSTKRKGGGRQITALDIFEVTATPAPMNNETRVLATKAVVQDLEQQLHETRTLLAEIREQLENMQQKTADVTDKEPEEVRSVDPLRSKADATTLDVLSGGESLRKPPRHKPKQPATPRLSVAELRAQTHQVTLDVLTGGKP